MALRVVLRSSPLSLKQGEELKQWIPELVCELLALTSPGDRDKNSSLLYNEVPPDFFTRDLDVALLEGRADLALHSAKDLPWPLPRGLGVFALSPRKDGHDALVSRVGWTLESLPPGSRVGTSSPSRRDQLLAARPDLDVVSLRGNIEERISWIDQGKVDAVIVAACALQRLGLPSGTTLPFDTHPLQGYLALVGCLTNSKLCAKLAPFDQRNSWGLVSIAGAGPGTKELSTLKTLQVLQRAEVVFYDALIDKNLLSQTKAELVPVGKRAGKHTKTQEQTNELLYQASLSGKRIVRLKGGDPFVYGRGSEEADYLSSRLVRYEVIPGVSAAQAAAAYAEIPLTQRNKAESFAVTKGYPPEEARPANVDTNVVYMPSNALAHLASQLEDMRPGETVALVRDAALPGQQVQVVSAVNLAATAKGQINGLSIEGEGPVIMIAGPTVDARAGNGWFVRQRRVLYTGTEVPFIPDGVRFEHVPFICFEECDARQRIKNGTEAALDKVYGQASDMQDQLSERHTITSELHVPYYGWIVFTSRHAVAIWFALQEQRGFDVRALAGINIAAVGKTTAQSLSTRGLRADIVATVESGEGLVSAFAKLTLSGQKTKPKSLTGFEKRVLLPSSDKARPTVKEGLTELGYDVTPLTLYKTIAAPIPAELELEVYDEIIFTSPSTVEACRAHFGRLPVRPVLTARGAATEAALNAWSGAD